MRRGTLLFALLGLLSACAPQRGEEPPSPPKAPEAPRVAVRVLTPKAGLLTREAQASATLEAERESLVAAGASGRVVRALPAGTQVQAGEGVVFLDPIPFQEALEAARLSLAQAEANLQRAEAGLGANREALRASLEGAKAQLEAARRRYEEGKRLLELGALAEVELKALEAQYRQAQSAYKSAEEALARLERGEELRLLRLQVEAARLQVRQAERNLRESVVRAPFPGEVVEVYAREGEFLGAGSRAFRLAARDQLLAKVYLPPERAQGLDPSTPFTLRQNGQRVPARLLRRTELPGANRLVEVVLKPQAPGLLPGPAEVRYREKVGEGFLLPAGAVVREGGQAFVFVVEGGRVRKTPIAVQGQAGNEVAVRGLEEGTRVVHPVPEGLEDGDPVEVVP